MLNDVPDLTRNALGIRADLILNTSILNPVAHDSCHAHKADLWEVVETSKERYVVVLDLTEQRFVLFHSVCWDAFWGASNGR